MHLIRPFFFFLFLLSRFFFLLRFPFRCDISITRDTAAVNSRHEKAPTHRHFLLRHDRDAVEPAHADRRVARGLGGLEGVLCLFFCFVMCCVDDEEEEDRDARLVLS